jgi:hypothetical protein
VLAHLLVTAGTLCFNPTPSAGLALWSALSLLLMVLCLPPVFRGESFWIARQRVASVMRGDAVLWMSLVAVLYVGCQVLNEPRVLEYAPELPQNYLICINYIHKSDSKSSREKILVLPDVSAGMSTTLKFKRVRDSWWLKELEYN